MPTPEPLALPNPADAISPGQINRIATLLWVIVLALLMAFCFFAGSFCITLLLAAFLSILLDPVVTFLESWRIPRSLSAGLLIIAGMLALVFSVYSSYNHLASFADSVPQSAERIRELIKPLNQKIEKVKESAQSLNSDLPAKKVPEVKIRETVSWPSYLIRGVGPLWGSIIIVGVVPFLIFFFLVRKKQMYERLTISLGGKIDAPKFVNSLTRMVRGFALGNLIIGLVMALITVLVLSALKMQGAVLLGILSGFLNLIPFLGVVLAAVLPLGAAILQFTTAGPFIAISLTVIFLHIISANLLIPKFIGSRVHIGPAAATAGILFWGWLWGPIGVLLAVPLTAFVKLVADCHP